MNSILKQPFSNHLNCSDIKLKYYELFIKVGKKTTAKFPLKLESDLKSFHLLLKLNQ